MEIERKFLVDKLPTSLDILKTNNIEQGYLSIVPEVRIRMLNDQYYLTVKSTGSLTRDEFEIEISNETYLDLKKNIIGKLLIKKRHYVDIGNFVAELDIYKNFENLKIVEVEFITEAQASQFIVPEWFGKEVTYDEEFKNKNLFKILNG
jgi:CYTH domain-containing protein